MKVFREKQYSRSRSSPGIRMFLAIVSSLICAGCSWDSLKKQAPIDRSILTDKPCVAPCWQGISPGRTSSSEAWEILARLELLDHESSPWRGKQLEEGVEWIAWRTLAGGAEGMPGSLYAYDGVVAQIEVSLDFEMSLKEVLDKYGSPDKVQAFSGSAEIASTTINYYYPQKGLIFVSWGHGVSGLESFALEATTPVTLVYYFKPTSMDRLFSQLPEFTRRLRHGTKGVQDWPGFGPIEVVP